MSSVDSAGEAPRVGCSRADGRFELTHFAHFLSGFDWKTVQVRPTVQPGTYHVSPFTYHGRERRATRRYPELQAYLTKNDVRKVAPKVRKSLDTLKTLIQKVEGILGDAENKV